MINACLIDTGLDEDLLGNSLVNNIEIAEGKKDFDWESNLQKEVNHGTICASIIKFYCPNVTLSSIKLNVDAKRSSSSDSLIEALNCCLELNVNVINMSMGTIVYSDFWRINKAINKLVSQGKIIIAACNNKNTFTVPACLPEVIGICTKKELYGSSYEIIKKTCDGIDYIASSRHMIDGNLTPLSNSYAAPFITAKICQYLFENPKADTNEVRKYLDKNATNYDDEYQTRQALIHTNSAKLDSCYKTVRKVRNIEEPVVCIYDYPLVDLVKIKNFFIEKGYNCLVVANILQDDFVETEYVNFGNESIVENALKSLNTVYNPDLLIIGINGLPDFKITNYIDVDIVCKDGILTTDEGENIKMDKDLFSQLYSVLGGEDD